MLIAFNRIDQAIDQLKATLEKDPKDKMNLFNLGLLFENKTNTLKEEVNKISEASNLALEAKRKIASHKDKAEVFIDELKRTKAKLKTAKPNQKPVIQSQINKLEASIAKDNEELKLLEGEKVEAEKAVGDEVANNAKIKLLVAQINELKQKTPGFYIKSLEVDSLYFDALYQLGAFYYNSAVEVKKNLNSMDMETYKKEGAKLESEVSNIYKNDALPYFEKAYWKVKQADEVFDALEQIYTQLKDEKKLAKLRASKPNLDPAFIKDLIEQFEIVKRNGKPFEISFRAAIVAEAYLGMKNEQKYVEWKKIEEDYLKK
jgi:hypothetical protein